MDVPGADKRLKRLAHVALNSFGGRAARVGGTKVHVAHAVFKVHGPHDSEVHHRKGGHLRVRHLVQAVFEIRNAYHVASG